MVAVAVRVVERAAADAAAANVHGDILVLLLLLLLLHSARRSYGVIEHQWMLMVKLVLLNEHCGRWRWRVRRREVVGGQALVGSL